jgi:hypothetical protein
LQAVDLPEGDRLKVKRDKCYDHALFAEICSQQQKDVTMTRSKQASKRKGRRKTLPVVGAAGVSLAVAGGASATSPTEHAPLQDTAPRPMITLGEEEISDVNLGTFYVLDKENIEFGDRVQLAQRGCRGCGCRGCAVRACRGCGGCGCRGCAVRFFGGCSCGGCGCGCASGCRIWTGWGWIWVC